MMKCWNVRLCGVAAVCLLAISMLMLAGPSPAEEPAGSAANLAGDEPDWTFQVLFTGNRATEIHPRRYPSRPLLGGLAYETTLLQQLNRDALPTLILDTGNFARLKMTPDAWFRADTLLTYFAQHDFHAVNVTHIDLRYGVEELRAIAEKGDVPLISANLFDSKTGELVFPPFKIVELPLPAEHRTLKVGIIGVAADHSVAGVAPYNPQAPPTVPGAPRAPTQMDMVPQQEPTWYLNDAAPGTPGPLTIHPVSDRRVLLAQAGQSKDVKPTPAPDETKTKQSGLTSEVSPEEERRLQQSLQEGLSFFEFNMERSMKLEAGPAAADKMKKQEEQKQERPIQFAPIGVYHYPMNLSTETPLRPGAMPLSETMYRPGMLPGSQTETVYAPSTQSTETTYGPVMKAIPNTFDRRKPAEGEPTPAPTATPGLTPSPQPPAESSDAAERDGGWQYVQIEGSDVIFSRRAAEGGGDRDADKEEAPAPASDPGPSESDSPEAVRSDAELANRPEAAILREIAGVQVRDPLACIGAVLPQLTKDESCDVIIVMSYYPMNNTRALMVPLAEDVNIWLVGDWIKPGDPPEQSPRGWVLPAPSLGQHLLQSKAQVGQRGRLEAISLTNHAIDPSKLSMDPVVQALVADCQARIAASQAQTRADNGAPAPSPMRPSVSH